jgi:hypothetical protein
LIYNRLSHNKTTNNIEIQDVKVKQGNVCGSVHCLVRGKIYIPYINIIKVNVEMDGVNLKKIMKNTT